MDPNKKQKNLKQIRKANVLESLKDLGSSVGDSVKNDLLAPSSEEFFNQIFGPRVSKKYSGEINPGQSLEMGEVFSGKAEENKKLRQQISLERKLSQEEKSLVEKKANDLRVQLHALTQEVVNLANTTATISEDLKIAAVQAPANPGIYHIIFFEKLLEFLKSFRKKVQSASVWLQASNKRAEKKNYWSMYKKKGSSFLLAPDHYLQRSAG